METLLNIVAAATNETLSEIYEEDQVITIKRSIRLRGSIPRTLAMANVGTTTYCWNSPCMTFALLF